MGQHALIVGASSGIGAALARELASEGYDVGLIARRTDRLAEVAERVRARGGVAAYRAADVNDPAQLKAAIVALEEVLGPVEVIIANAGVGENTDAANLDLAHVRRVLRTNLEGVVLAIGAVLPAMTTRGHGRIGAVTSIAGMRPIPMIAAYGASKAGASAFLEALRADLRGSGVTVTDLCPGYVKTDMVKPIEGRYPPFTMDVDDTARRMVRALLAGRDSLVFPWPLAWASRLAAILPDAFLGPLLRRLAPKPPPALPG
jgi:short-subunit dehydrogenase